MAASSPAPAGRGCRLGVMIKTRQIVAAEAAQARLEASNAAAQQAQDRAVLAAQAALEAAGYEDVLISRVGFLWRVRSVRGGAGFSAANADLDALVAALTAVMPDPPAPAEGEGG